MCIQIIIKSFFFLVTFQSKTLTMLQRDMYFSIKKKNSDYIHSTTFFATQSIKQDLLVLKEVKIKFGNN